MERDIGRLQGCCFLDVVLWVAMEGIEAKAMGPGTLLSVTVVLALLLVHAIGSIVCGDCLHMALPSGTDLFSFECPQVAGL